MNEIELFPENSAEDLVLRGYSQSEILDMTGFDVGYHGNGIKKQLKGIDRFEYKVKYVQEHCDCDMILAVLNDYAIGLDKQSVLYELGISGVNIVKLKDLFTTLGYENEFKIADKEQKKGSMRRGTVEKYGIDNVFKLSEFQDKASQTRKEKYGAKYTLCNESVLCEQARATFNKHMSDSEFAENVSTKRKTTMMERYGVEVPSQSPKIQAKIKNTMLARYGVDRYAKLPEMREKQRERIFKHNAEYQEKARNTMLKRYGVEHWVQAEEARQQQSKRMKENFAERNIKARNTCMSKYGVLYSSQRPEQRKAMSDFMIKHSSEFVEKSKKTSLERYGVEFIQQLPEYRQQQSERMSDSAYQKHIIQVKKENGTLSTSKPELILYNLLVEYFGKSDVIMQYQDNRYSFMCDFYIKSRDLFVELNAMWTHGGHWYDINNNKDNDLLDCWKAKQTKFYDNACVNWTTRDVEKRNTAMQNNLNYVVFWDDKLQDANLWFAMGCPDGRDWDKEYSWLPVRRLEFECVFPDMIDSTRDCIQAVKSANWVEFYKNEITAWNDNPKLKWGTLQAQLYSNRYKYLGKLPDELTSKEILRGLSISGLVDGYTSFNNAVMIDFVSKYNIKSIYDPCAGWGERMLTAGILNIKYTGCDINKNLFKGYEQLQHVYDLKNIQMICDDSSKFDAINLKHDAVFTCPPYGSREIYTADGAENLDSIEFLHWWTNIIKHSICNTTQFFAYQIDQKHKNDMNEIVEQNGFHLIEQIPVGMTQVRHTNRARGSQTKKNYEELQIFARD